MWFDLHLSCTQHVCHGLQLNIGVISGEKAYCRDSVRKIASSNINSTKSKDTPTARISRTIKKKTFVFFCPFNSGSQWVPVCGRTYSETDIRVASLFKTTASWLQLYVWPCVSVPTVHFSGTCSSFLVYFSPVFWIEYGTFDHTSPHHLHFNNSKWDLSIFPTPK